MFASKVRILQSRFLGPIGGHPGLLQKDHFCDIIALLKAIFESALFKVTLCAQKKPYRAQNVALRSIFLDLYGSERIRGSDS